MTQFLILSSMINTMNKTKLTDKQFNALKERYIDRVVDGMSVEDLVVYVAQDMQKWIDDHSFNDAMVEIEEFFDEDFTDTIQSVIKGCSDD